MVSWWWCTSDVECSELIGCSSAGKLQLTWKLTWRIATEPSDSSWAVLQHIAAELPLLQLSWQTAAKLTHHDWENILRLRWQIAKDLALHSWADVLQLVCHSRWQNTLEQINCRWADKMQLSWHNAGRAGKELTLCSSATWLQTGSKTAAGLKGVHLSWQFEVDWERGSQAERTSLKNQLVASSSIDCALSSLGAGGLLQWYM